MIVIREGEVDQETENDQEAGAEDALEVVDVEGSRDQDLEVERDLGTDQGTNLDHEVVQRAETDQDPIPDIDYMVYQ